MAKGYAIVRINVDDPDRYKDYAAGTQGTLDPHGGRFIVRGGEPSASRARGTPDGRS